VADVGVLSVGAGVLRWGVAVSESPEPRASLRPSGRIIGVLLVGLTLAAFGATVRCGSGGKPMCPELEPKSTVTSCDPKQPRPADGCDYRNGCRTATCRCGADGTWLCSSIGRYWRWE
jgi:hypothetical protein